MAIPQRISFLEESMIQGMANLHSSGIEKDEIYSLGSSGDFEESRSQGMANLHFSGIKEDEIYSSVS